jgi:hypothetical protein
MTNLVLTKSSGPKCHAVAFTAPIFAGFCVYHTDLSGRGEGAVRGGGKAAKQSECPFTAKVRPFIQRLSISQTSEHFLPEVRNVAFCILILKSVKILKSAQVLTKL